MNDRLRKTGASGARSARGPGRRVPVAGIIALVLAGCVLSGCAADVVDPKKTQIALRFDIAEQTDTRIAKVDCPSGVEVIPGARFSCTVTARDGTEALAVMEILNEAADLRVVRLTNP